MYLATRMNTNTYGGGGAIMNLKKSKAGLEGGKGEMVSEKIKLSFKIILLY